MQNRAVSDRPDLHLPEVLIEHVEDIGNVDALLRPLFDVLWQSFGLSRCNAHGLEGAIPESLRVEQARSISWSHQDAGYIVGLNKGRHRDVGQGATYPKPSPNDSEGPKGVKERMQSNPKIHYISHVVRNEGNPYAVDNCVLYTVYDVWNGGEKKAGEPPIAACSEAPRIVGTMASAHADHGPDQAGFGRSTV